MYLPLDLRGLSKESRQSYAPSPLGGTKPVLMTETDSVYLLQTIKHSVQETS